MVPLDLQTRLTNSDKETIDRVYHQLMAYRKVRPALELVAQADWVDMGIIKPYLMASMEGRSESRKLMVDESWNEFWSSIN